MERYESSLRFKGQDRNHGADLFFPWLDRYWLRALLLRAIYSSGRAAMAGMDSRTRFFGLLDWGNTSRCRGINPLRHQRASRRHHIGSLIPLVGSPAAHTGTDR